MLIRTQHGERRLTPPLHKLLLTAHIVVSVGWLGIALAKLALLVTTVRTLDTPIADAMLLAVSVVDRVFPPAAILTLVTGMALGLVTKWGIVRYSWVLVKLVVTVAVPITSVRLAERLLLNAQAGLPVTPLLWLGVAHIAMLTAATVLSVYKPWGLSWIGRRQARRSTPAPAQRGRVRVA